MEPGVSRPGVDQGSKNPGPWAKTAAKDGATMRPTMAGFVRLHHTRTTWRKIAGFRAEPFPCPGSGTIQTGVKTGPYGCIFRPIMRQSVSVWIGGGLLVATIGWRAGLVTAEQQKPAPTP